MWLQNYHELFERQYHTPASTQVFNVRFDKKLHLNICRTKKTEAMRCNFNHHSNTNLRFDDVDDDATKLIYLGLP